MKNEHTIITLSMREFIVYSRFDDDHVVQTEENRPKVCNWYVSRSMLCVVHTVKRARALSAVNVCLLADGRVCVKCLRQTTFSRCETHSSTIWIEHTRCENSFVKLAQWVQICSGCNGIHLHTYLYRSGNTMMVVVMLMLMLPFVAFFLNVLSLWKCMYRIHVGCNEITGSQSTSLVRSILRVHCILASNEKITRPYVG